MATPIILNVGTIITRTAYCEKCFKNNRPKFEEKFWTYGEKGWHPRTASCTAHYVGVTPHTYRIEKVIGQNVVYTYLCMMSGCGITIFKSYSGNEKIKLKKDERKRGIMTLTQWRSLVSLTRDAQYHI